MSSNVGPKHEPERVDGRRALLILLAIPSFLLLFLFLPAGDLAWTRGWLFASVFLAFVMGSLGFLSFVNADVLAARSRSHEGRKHWDKVLVWFLRLAGIAILVVAGLDDGRFHWFPAPWWVTGVGYLFMLVGAVVITWAEAVNRFFEPHVRIQSDRGHVVIDTGPYGLVRHPGYVGFLFMVAGIPLALGSLWALIPASLACALIALRTRWEDETLQAELSGYKEYAKRVSYRLIPGVW